MVNQWGSEAHGGGGGSEGAAPPSKKPYLKNSSAVYSKVVQLCLGALQLCSRCHCTALALFSHFCRKTALRSHFPRISARKLPCARTFLAFLQENCPALALSSHFCRKTALRSHCPALPLCCMASELRSNLLRRIMRRGHTSFL